jgi:two-component system response regulator YesN
VTACRRREMTVVLAPEETDSLSSDMEIFGKIINIIEEHYCDPRLSIAFICEMVYSSKTSICAVFKRETGKTLNETITDYRIAKACKLLSDTENSLNTIAVRVGFRDHNYFSKVFKKRTGVTPSAYRRNSFYD